MQDNSTYKAIIMNIDLGLYNKFRDYWIFGPGLGKGPLEINIKKFIRIR